MADSLYGESTEFLEGLRALDLDFVGAMQANHGSGWGRGSGALYELETLRSALYRWTA